MGQKSSTVTAGIKSQADGKSNALYAMADVHGNGVLATIARDVIRNGSKPEWIQQLDDAIRAKVRPFLYNEGNGKMIPIETVINFRHRERTGSPFTGISRQKLEKFICWRLDARGAVGETLLHVCFLSGLPEHMGLLALRLVHCFPHIINDFYISEEYYGETALHMGIVNENAEIVRLLLKSGAAVNARCSGNFFNCDDLKRSRSDSADQEHCLLAKNTDYIGHLYWGEYPLAFAACLSQDDCFRLLCAFGASPNSQDSNGNTVLHICTIRSNLQMFQLAIDMGGDLRVKNGRDLTPLMLAAYMAKQEMFDRIVQQERVVQWTYGGLLCAVYPLEDLDSIEPGTGKMNAISALTLAVFGKSPAHLTLLSGLLRNLLHQKWETYAKTRLFHQMRAFIVYFVVLFVCFLTRPTPFEREHGNQTLVCLLNASHLDYGQQLSAKEMMHSLLHCVVFVSALLYLKQAYLHLRNVGRRMYALSLSVFPELHCFLFSCFLIVFGFLLEAICCWHSIGDIIWVLAVLLSALKFLFYCRSFKTVGPFVLMLYKIIVRDLNRFFIIYVIIGIGFSQAFYVIFLRYNRPDDPEFDIHKDGTIMSSVPESLIRMFIMSLTEFTVFFEHLEYCELAIVGKIAFVTYVLLVTICLMNLLIAMMTNTYTEVASLGLEWLRQWSAIILLMELSFDPATRLKFQKQYSMPMDNGQRIGLALKLRMSAEEIEREHKQTQAKRAKFNKELHGGSSKCSYSTSQERLQPM